MKFKIEICLGSSCFARGNSQVLNVLELYLKEENKSADVEIIGHLGMNNCSNGPVIKINEIEYLNKNCGQIVDIVGGLFNDKSE